MLNYLSTGKRLQKTMERSTMLLMGPLFQWPCSIAMLNYQRIYTWLRMGNISYNHQPAGVLNAGHTGQRFFRWTSPSLTGLGKFPLGMTHIAMENPNLYPPVN